MLRLCQAVHSFGLFFIRLWRKSYCCMCSSIYQFNDILYTYCTSSYYVHTKQRFMSHLFTFNLSTSILYHFFIYCIWAKRTQIHASDICILSKYIFYKSILSKQLQKRMLCRFYISSTFQSILKRQSPKMPLWKVTCYGDLHGSVPGSSLVLSVRPLDGLVPIHTSHITLVSINSHRIGFICK